MQNWSSRPTHLATLLLAVALAGCDEPFSPRVGPPALLRHAAGNGQSDTVGAILPESLGVRVLDGAGQPIAGVTVVWGHGPTAGTIDPAMSITGPDGVARTSWQLGPSPGGQSATATVTGVAPLTFSAVALSIVRAGALDWSLVHQGVPVPSTPIVGIGGTPAGDAFAATAAGQVYWFDGFGWTELLATQAPGALNAIWVPVSTAVFGVGLTTNADTAFVATFFGQNWGTPYRVPGGALHALHGTSLNDFWVVGSEIAHYDGMGWTSIPLPGGSAARAVFSVTPGAAFVGDDDGGLHLVDSTLTTLGTPRGSPIRALFGYAPDDMYAGDASGSVFHWNGSQWSNVGQVGTAPVVAMWGPGPGELWVVGSAYARLSGGSWSVLDDDDARAANVVGLWGSSAQRVWAVSDSLRITEYDGSRWREHWDSPVAFAGIWGTSLADLHVCGGQGTVQHFDGIQWSTDRLDGWQACRSVDGHGATLALASADAPFAYRFDGSDWERTVTGSALAGDIWVDPSGVAMAPGPNGMVLRYDGATWTALATGSPTTLRTVWGSAPDDVWAGGDGGAILHYDGTGWTPHASGVTGTIVGIWGSSATTIFAVTDDGGTGGTVLQYDGAQWRSVHDTGAPLRAIHGRTAADLLAVGDAGTIIRWDGTAWHAESSGFAEQLTDVWASPEGDVFAVGARGSILRGRR